MTARYCPVGDALLQELYLYAFPGPQQFLPGKPLELKCDVTKDEVRQFVQACGVLYERDAVSIIPDRAYDHLAQWLGDPAATAMDWQGYEEEVLRLADRLKGAWEWRQALLAGKTICACPEWDWSPHDCWTP